MQGDNKQKQVEMHQNFHDRCRLAIENGFYMEAILMEYAAIEGRMEVLLGVLGLPCNKSLPPEERKKFAISHRIKCANQLRKTCAAFEGTKLSKNYFDKLLKWVDKRNEYIHGLYKSELKYKERMVGAKALAVQGYELCKLLYAEVKRLRRFMKKQPSETWANITCSCKECSHYSELE